MDCYGALSVDRICARAMHRSSKKFIESWTQLYTVSMAHSAGNLLSVVMKRLDGTIMEKAEVIRRRRGAFKWMPVFFSNDLVHGSWWFVIGSFSCTLCAVVPLIQQYLTFYHQHDDLLPSIDFKTTWALLIVSGCFYTVGSIAFVRAFDEPPKPALLKNYKHFQSDELLGAWLFLAGTVPAVPYSLVFFMIEPSFTYFFSLCASSFFVLVTGLFVRGCYPSEKKVANYILPTCIYAVGPSIWVVQHLANDWLAGTWFFFWANVVLLIGSFLLMVVAMAVNGSPEQIFVWTSGFINTFIFLVGSMYFVSGSYPHASQFYYYENGNQRRQSVQFDTPGQDLEDPLASAATVSSGSVSGAGLGSDASRATIAQLMRRPSNINDGEGYVINPMLPPVPMTTIAHVQPQPQSLPPPADITPQNSSTITSPLHLHGILKKSGPTGTAESSQPGGVIQPAAAGAAATVATNVIGIIAGSSSGPVPAVKKTSLALSLPKSLPMTLPPVSVTAAKPAGSGSSPAKPTLNEDRAINIKEFRGFPNRALEREKAAAAAAMTAAGVNMSVGHVTGEDVSSATPLVLTQQPRPVVTGGGGGGGGGAGTMSSGFTPGRSMAGLGNSGSSQTADLRLMTNVNTMPLSKPVTTAPSAAPSSSSSSSAPVLQQTSTTTGTGGGAAAAVVTGRGGARHKDKARSNRGSIISTKKSVTYSSLAHSESGDNPIVTASSASSNNNNMGVQGIIRAVAAATANDDDDDDDEDEDDDDNE